LVGIQFPFAMSGVHTTSPEAGRNDLKGSGYPLNLCISAPALPDSQGSSYLRESAGLAGLLDTRSVPAGIPGHRRTRLSSLPCSADFQREELRDTHPKSRHRPRFFLREPK
jgi:hypothetical protein